MKIIAALTSPGQDGIIRAILEARGEWAPPWQQRGPPHGNGSDSTSGPEPVLELEVDPGRIWAED